MEASWRFWNNLSNFHQHRQTRDYSIPRFIEEGVPDWRDSQDFNYLFKLFWYCSWWVSLPRFLSVGMGLFFRKWMVVHFNSFHFEEVWELIDKNRTLPCCSSCSTRNTISYFNFFSILELYNLEMSTFFTTIGEMGLALYELYEVSGCPWVKFLTKNIYQPGRSCICWRLKMH